MERFIFKNSKIVIIQNINSIAKSSDDDEKNYSITILYVSGKKEWVQYGGDMFERDKDFSRFEKGNFLK